MEGYSQPKKIMIKEDSEETKLELRLGPPGHDQNLQHVLNKDFCYSNCTSHGAKRGFQGTISIEEGRAGEKKACPTGTTPPANYPANTLLIFKPSEKRVVQPPVVVGWPPVRTSRKNILSTSNSTKMASEPSKKYPEVESGGLKSSSSLENSLFVKINMDGVPIGRKVDLKAYDNYQRLSSAVDELFRGLLAAQGDSSAGLMEKQMEALVGSPDGNNGEYTLVYEDNEGDRILVGDVPWDMFISSAKRLRVLKRSELSIHQGSK